jgi:hypothetical protein
LSSSESIVETMPREQEENNGRVRFVERRENRPSKRARDTKKKKNSLLTALVEQTDVINLYGRGTVLHLLSRSRFIPVVYRWQCYVKRKEKQVKDNLMKISSHLLIDIVSNGDCLDTRTHLFSNKYPYLLK